MSESSILEEVSADRVCAHVEHITTTIPSRLAGSENAKRMAEYSAATLAQEGVAARVSKPGNGDDSTLMEPVTVEPAAEPSALFRLN